MRDQLAKELENIGLSEKEAKVYLAALELGPSTAQAIAAKATVNRSNTYVMIEQLIKRGLMSSFEKGKKRYFLAGKPTQLLYLLKEKRRVLDNEEVAINKILELIRVRLVEGSNIPTAVVYEGAEGLWAAQQLLMKNTEEVWELVPVDIVREYLPEISKGDVRENFSKQFKIRSLYSSKDGPTQEVKNNVEYRYFSPDLFPIETEVIIFSSTVVITAYSPRIVSIHINNEKIAKSARVLYQALWDIAGQK